MRPFLAATTKESLGHRQLMSLENATVLIENNALWAISAYHKILFTKGLSWSVLLGKKKIIGDLLLGFGRSVMLSTSRA